MHSWLRCLFSTASLSVGVTVACGNGDVRGHGSPQIRTSAAAEMEALANTLFELGITNVGVLVTISPKDSLPSQYFEQFSFFANPLGIKVMSVASINIDSWLTDFTLDGTPPLSFYIWVTRQAQCLPRASITLR